MSQPLKSMRYHLSLDSAIDEGFAYKRKTPWKNPFSELKKNL